MALEVGSHEEAKRTFPLVVGTAVLTPVALNPDKAQLVELGINVQEEPKYIFTSKKGVDWRVISIYLGGKNNVLDPATGKLVPTEILAELRFLLGTTPGPLYINDEGRFAGEGKKGALGESARLEYQSEHKLIDFVKCLGRVGNNKKCSLENIKALIENGDTSELSEMLEQCVNAGFQVRVALGVEKSKYQRAMTESFAMDNATSLTYFHDQLAKQVEYAGEAYYGTFFSNSSTLQVQNATKLRFYNEQEALEYEDQKAQRLTATATMGTGNVANVKAAPVPSMSGDEEAAMYQQPGVRLGTATQFASDVPAQQREAQPSPGTPPIGDDDNDLPF